MNGNRRFESRHLDSYGCESRRPFLFRERRTSKRRPRLWDKSLNWTCARRGSPTSAKGKPARALNTIRRLSRAQPPKPSGGRPRSGWTRSWIGFLAERAEVIYAHNARFRQLLRQRGNAGRDWLWAFMRHWLSARIGEYHPHLHARLPASYCVGHELPLQDRPYGKAGPK